MTMNRGQVGLCTTNGIMGRLIRAVTRSGVNHCVIGLGNGMDMSAEPGGVAVHPDEYWGPIEWSRFPFTPEQADAMVAFALDQQGKPYAWLDDLLIGVACLLRTRTPAWVARRLSRDDRWQCAELCDAALRSIGYNILAPALPGAVYPGMFSPYWKRHHWC